MSTHPKPSGALRPSCLLPAGVLLGLAAVAVAVGLAVWPRPQPTPKEEEVPPPPDPRLSYEGPFRNVHPDVAYVGDRACVSCHRDIGRSYSKHPMGRTLAPFDGPATDQPLDEKHHHPFTGLGLFMRVVKKGDTWLHTIARRDPEGEEVGRIEHPVHYRIGSASHGSSYLTVRDGFVYQTAISWFTQKSIWDVSPGFVESQTTGRPVIPTCLFCHSNRFTPLPDEMNRYKEPIFDGHAIGCERCHGPGQKHAAEPATGFDPAIVNPARLPWRLRENVCEQCHLQGVGRSPRRGRDWFDWRPGLPLEEFLSVHVEDNPDDRKANNHVEQMRASACFVKSPDERKLGCLSCHDPHVKPTDQERVGHYRDRCLNCHQDKGCKLHRAERERKAPGDSCIDCHMPKYGISDVVHASASDHTIPRRSKLAGRKGEAREYYPVRNFHADRLRADDPELKRDLGIAIVLRLRPGHPLLDREGTRAAEALETSLKAVPSDIEAREALANLCNLLDRPGDAERHFEMVLQKRPRREASLLGAAQSAESSGKNPAALGYWRRVVEVSPYNAPYRQSLARSLSLNGRHEESLEQTRAWLRLDPASVAARVALFHLLLKQGKTDEAGEVLAVFRRLKVSNLRELEQRYREAGGRR